MTIGEIIEWIRALEAKGSEGAGAAATALSEHASAGETVRGERDVLRAEVEEMEGKYRQQLNLIATLKAQSADSATIERLLGERDALKALVERQSERIVVLGATRE